jgi:hypothetical protein
VGRVGGWTGVGQAKGRCAQHEGSDLTVIS